MSWLLLLASLALFVIGGPVACPFAGLLLGLALTAATASTDRR